VKRSTIRNRSAVFVAAAVLILLQGCASLAPDKREATLETAASLDGFNPAGLWLYEDKLVTGEVDLDEQGNGSYPWEEGFFVTEAWSDGTWRGTWHQPGNNREGGFELRLTDDYTFAFGRWWYTRIGENTAPGKPDGKFTLTRF